MPLKPGSISPLGFVQPPLAHVAAHVAARAKKPRLGGAQERETATDSRVGSALTDAGTVAGVRWGNTRYGVWLTAPAALTMPAPQPPEQAPGNGRAVFFNSVSTAAGVNGRDAADCTSATTPATCGAAIEVPL